jgi:hypothetical protein
VGESPKIDLVPALIEHESCISLKHSRCWDPSSRLKTTREEGAGFFQLTRAYNNSGGIRFDVISELRSKYPKELYELNWSNVYQRPDLQIRAGILKSKENYLQFEKIAENTIEALAFADAAYNGGIGGVNTERRACYISKGCDHTRWFNNVELYCMKSKSALYGNRSACDINRHHVRDVILVRSSKYSKFFN